MRVRLAICSLGLAGCGAVGAATGGVQTGISGVQGATGTGQQLKGMGDQSVGLFKKKEGDQNGDDDDRLRAKESAINVPLSDSLDPKKGDKYDWRKFQLLFGKAGVATFELFWDTEEANIDMDVYDAFGVNIGKSPPRLDGQSSRRVLVSITKAGTYYMRVMGKKESDKSIYTVDVKWNGPPPPVDVPPTPKDPVVATGPAVPPGPVAPELPPSLLTDPNKVLGNIISAYRDGGGWVLYIDRGSAQKVHAGQTGVILEGPDGEKLVEGGNVSISQVVDANKSIARCNLNRPPGKNKRVVINLR